MRLTKMLLIIVGLLALLTLGYIYYDANNKMQLPWQAQPEKEESEVQVQSAAPKGTVNKETGEVDQKSFEQNQAVKKDDSLDTLQTEVDSTVILDEDFSDIK
jgi:hypothetical protein